MPALRATLSDLFVPHMQLGDLRRNHRFGSILERLVSNPAGCVTQVDRVPAGGVKDGRSRTLLRG